MLRRKLTDLHGIGKSMASDFELLGVKSVADLARCAVAQAKDPQLPLERCY